MKKKKSIININKLIKLYICKYFILLSLKINLNKNLISFELINKIKI